MILFVLDRKSVSFSFKMSRASKRLATKDRVDYTPFYKTQPCESKKSWNPLHTIQTWNTLFPTTVPTRKQLFCKYGLPCSLLSSSVALDETIKPENPKNTDYEVAIQEFVKCLQVPFPGRSEPDKNILLLQLKAMGLENCATYLETESTDKPSPVGKGKKKSLVFQFLKQYENPDFTGSAYYFGDFKTNLSEHQLRGFRRNGMETMRQNNAIRKIRYHLHNQESIKNNRSLYATEQDYMNDKCKNVATMYEWMFEHPDFIAVPESRNYALAAEYKAFEIHHELATTPTPPTQAIGAHLLFATRSYVAMVRHILGILDDQ